MDKIVKKNFEEVGTYNLLNRKGRKEYNIIYLCVLCVLCG
jgi:hypothetical protein